MRCNRLTQILLAIIVVVLCTGAVTWLGTSLAGAAESTAPEGLPEVRSRALTSGPATLPLRWRVTFARQTDPTTGTSGTFCGTTVLVWNTAQSPVETQVEWFHANSSIGYATLTIPADSTNGFWTQSAPTLAPFNQAGVITDSGVFFGTAQVHAADPRVIVSAFLVCKDSVGPSPLPKLVGTTNIPAYPVGQTLEYFQAGMPATWTPPVAVPEVPE